MNAPFLLYEFTDEKGNPDVRVFESPVEILTTYDLHEIKRIFDRVEQALEEGYYAAGYVSYEAAPAFDDAFSVHSDPQWPLVWFGIFSDCSKKIRDFNEGDFSVSKWEMTGDFEVYQEGIEKVKQGIERGDTYQVNYTTRLEALFSGDDYSFYRRLIRNQQPSYGAYLNMGVRRLLSASPELFFRVDGKAIRTKPMKGTAKRGRFYEEDQHQKELLRTSDKERSENLMIVDLLRNDLGRIAVPGTVRVPKLFEVETYQTVHQMTSTIEASLPDHYTTYELFHALFPCGSITGAPKVRTMDYISRLEDSPREVYCGAIGFFTPDKEAVFNVPIRTVMVDQNSKQAVYGTGGGVTWDSTPKGEFEELHAKASVLTENRPSFQLLETMRLEEGEFPLWSYHIDRVLKSAQYFQYPITRQELEQQLHQVTGTYSIGLYKTRLLIASTGEVTIEVEPIQHPAQNVECMLAASPVDEGNPFLFHKTTHREVYERHQSPGFTSTLLWNSNGELTEFTIANVVVKQNNHYYTPPVTSGLLAGTYRQKLLEDGVVQEKVIHKDELNQCEEIWMINAVRGWVRVSMKECGI
ncbi:aminodeoxychorismate synthase component I [Halobacillus litoralis]|uniref:aminodeoxychorismate synthase component I n=1 Tax=Halobacillus litoralis TaxID=45668 RepID=UPI001CFED279|nr:aminodeoxychorismate synthase component I [Halobacillus litoralis]